LPENTTFRRLDCLRSEDRSIGRTWRWTQNPVSETSCFKWKTMTDIVQNCDRYIRPNPSIISSQSIAFSDINAYIAGTQTWQQNIRTKQWCRNFGLLSCQSCDWGGGWGDGGMGVSLNLLPAQTRLFPAKVNNSIQRYVYLTTGKKNVISEMRFAEHSIVHFCNANIWMGAIAIGRWSSAQYKGFLFCLFCLLCSPFLITCFRLTPIDVNELIPWGIL
jgi:hypothetical protein